MFLNEIFGKAKSIIVEGGNLSSNSPGWQGAQNVAADEIDLKVHNRTFMVNLLDKLLHDIDNAFKKQFKQPLWSPELLQGKQFLGGSSLHFFNTTGITDQQFVAKKPKVGDIDTQCDKELEPQIEQFLNSINGKRVGDAVFLGFSRGNEQLNGLFEFQDPPIKIQIDFEFGKYNTQTNMPDDWYRFSHSSAWEDIEVGVKGVMHKYLYRSLAKAGPTEKYIAKLTGLGKKRAMAISGPITDANFSFAVASGAGGGARAKYKPYIDPETGQEKVIDGIPVMEPVKPEDSDYIQDLSQQFELFFGQQPNGNDSQLQQSFVGTLALMNKYLDDNAKKTAFETFLQIVFEPGAQMITAGDPARDREVKFAAIDQMIEKLGLKSLRPTAVKMAQEYEKDYHDLETFKQANPTSKRPRADMMKARGTQAESIIREGKEKFNYELSQKGFHFEQEINGVTYKVYNKKGGSDNIKIDALDQKKQVIGHASFWRHQYKDGLESLSTSVEPAWQGKGIATNMYAVMRMLGVNIYPASMQSDDGKAMWSKWNKQGDAQHIKSMNTKVAEGLNEAEVKAQLRKNMPHLKDLKPLDFLDLLDELHDGNGNFKLQNIPLNVKVDGFGGRFGKNTEGKPFMGTSNTEPRYKAGFVDYHKQKGTTDPDVLARSQLFDNLFNEMMKAIGLVDSKLGPDFLNDKQVTCEVLFLPFATTTPEGKLKFVGIAYDELPKGVQLALVPFRVVQASTGEEIPEAQEIVKQLTSLGQQGSVMFIDNSLTQNEALDVTAIVPPLENIDEFKSVMSNAGTKRDLASVELRRSVEASLAPIKVALEKAIIQDPNIVGKDLLGKDYEGIVINSRLGPIKITSQEQRDVISAKQAAKASARQERPRDDQKSVATVAIGSAIGHMGHQQLFDYAVKKAGETNGDPYFFIGNAEGKDDPIPVPDKVKTWHLLYPQYAKNISAVTMDGGSLIQKVKHELINPLPNKAPRYSTIYIVVGKDREMMANQMATALMKAVNKFQGYEDVKVIPFVTSRNEDEGGTGVSGTALRNAIKTQSPEEAFNSWNKAFNGGSFGAQKLPPDWIQHLMDLATQNMNIKKPAPMPKQAKPQVKLPQQQEPQPMEAKQRLDPSCWKGYRKAGTKMKGGTRVNNCVKVGEAWEAEIADAINILLENFADGKNPQDKGDSKRHGINTKASVSSLRKTAKQGGRKGQLAHWLANMKAGRAKNK